MVRYGQVRSGGTVRHGKVRRERQGKGGETDAEVSRGAPIDTVAPVALEVATGVRSPTVKSAMAWVTRGRRFAPPAVGRCG